MKTCFRVPGLGRAGANPLLLGGQNLGEVSHGPLAAGWRAQRRRTRRAEQDARGPRAPEQVAHRALRFS